MKSCDDSTCSKPNKPVIKVPIVWILGGPGSGKGTQCEKIVSKYGFVHISSGDLLRAEVGSGSKRGKELKEVMDKAGLVSNDIVFQLLKEAILKNHKNAKGFLIDGYPRLKDQGVMFEEKVCPVTCILFFDVADATMMERLMNRAKTSNRSDDNEEIMKQRIKVFNDAKNMILEAYVAKIKRITAEGTVDDIFREVQKYLDPLIS